MYKLVTVDLDGTMLTRRGIITEGTKNAIKNTMEKGIDVIIASGRPIDSIKTIAKEIGSKNYFIAGNGALIYDIKKDEVIYEKILDKKKVLEIAEICEKNNMTYNIYTQKTMIADKLKYNVLYYYKENLNKKEELKTNITIVNNIKEYVEKSENEKFLKITICDESKLIFNSIIKKINAISGVKAMDVYHATRKTIKQGTEDVNIEYYYTEISLKDVDKWDAIKYLLNKLNINQNEIVSIGDNINDKEMIENAGLGVAMGQSMPEIKRIADYVTNDNENEGVKNVLEIYC